MTKMLELTLVFRTCRHFNRLFLASASAPMSLLTSSWLTCRVAATDNLQILLKHLIVSNKGSNIPTWIFHNFKSEFKKARSKKYFECTVITGKPVAWTDFWVQRQQKIIYTLTLGISQFALHSVLSNFRNQFLRNPHSVGSKKIVSYNWGPLRII